MKKLIVLMCMLLPLGVFSQEVKIAVVNFAEVFNMMPELDDAETQFASFRAQYEKDLQDMQNDLNAKNEEYIRLQDSLPENLKLRREQDMQQLYERMQTFYSMFQQDAEQKQAELYAPIQEKLQKAIEEVSAEQGYTLVFNRLDQILLYIGPSALDATPLVKAKLGLR